MTKKYRFTTEGSLMRQTLTSVEVLMEVLHTDGCLTLISDLQMLHYPENAHSGAAGGAFASAPA